MAKVDRTPFGNKHTEACANIDCPCYQEGNEVRAWSHWSMLLWMAERDPDLVRKALHEAENSRAYEEARLNGSES